DELSEIEACIETGNGETIHQYAGWSSAEQAPDDLSDGSEWSVHAPHCNSLPEARGIDGGPFGSGYEWAVLSKAMIYLDQGGRHCFEVSGQVDGQMCRSLFLDEGATALGVADGVYCEDLEAGIYPISWFVVGGRTGDGDSPLGESYSFNY